MNQQRAGELELEFIIISGEQFREAEVFTSLELCAFNVM